MKTLFPTILAGLMVSACAPGIAGDADDLTPGDLAYHLSEPASVSYAVADTTRFTVEAGPMGEMRVIGAHAGVAAMELRPAGAGVTATIRFPIYAGRFENPQQGAVTADESDIAGLFVVDVEPTGRIAVADTPVLSRTLLEITGPEALVRPLFAQLPARPIGAGGVWVDTVRTLEEELSTTSETFTVFRSTLVGDTTIDGRSMVLIDVRGDRQVEVRGESGGVDVVQRLSGTTTGVVVWDPRRRVLVHREQRGTLTGTLALPGLGVPELPVSAEVRQVVDLLP